MTPHDPIPNEDPTARNDRRKLRAAIAGAGALTLLLVPDSALADPQVVPASVPANPAPAADQTLTPLLNPAQILQPAIDTVIRTVATAAATAGPPAVAQPVPPPVGPAATHDAPLSGPKRASADAGRRAREPPRPGAHRRPRQRIAQRVDIGNGTGRIRKGRDIHGPAPASAPE
jgi:hypothetical protein